MALRNLKYCLISYLLLFGFFKAQAACPGTVVSNFSTSQTNICGPGATTINFTNLSTGPFNATSDYEWYLNGTLFDNTTGLAAPISQNISAVGTYNFMLVAIDNTIPCEDTSFVTVTIYPLPNASFTFNPNNVCGGTPINFNNTSTGTNGNTTYNWNFGDGNTSNQNNPTHSYGAGGTYNVTLTVTNGPGCTSTSNASVTMLDIPNVSIAGDDGDGDLMYCLLPGDPTTSEVVTFTNGTTGAISYEWDFGDGSPTVVTASNAPLTHTYSTYGTFTVTMTATHANGCTATETLTVVFEKFVSAALTLDITEYNGCAPHNLSTLQNLSVNANTYVWDFGDGTVITTGNHAPPNYSYTANGTYTITLTASNSCNTATATISPIIIIDAPQGAFTPSVTQGCAPQNVTFTNNSTGAVPANNYQWDMGNGNTYTNTTTPPLQTYPTTGSYDVVMIAGNSCGNDTVIHTINIDTIPTVDLISNPLDGCSPLNVQSNATATGGNLNWTWAIDGTNTYNTPNTIPDQVFTAPPGNATQNHTIQVTVSNQCGTDTDIETIVVHPEVVAIFTANDTICEGQSITFTDGSLGDNLTWSWDFGNGNTAGTQGPHTETYLTPGNYTVTLDVNGYCGTDQMTMNIVVHPIPVADISASPAAGCQSDIFNLNNASTPGGTYVWNFGAEATPTNANTYIAPSITYSDSGYQMITLNVNVNGCTNADTTFIDVQPLPIPDFIVTPNDGCTPLDVAFTNNTISNPGDIFSWDFGNGNTSAQQNPGNEIYTTVVNDTTYEVWMYVSSSNGCIDSLMQTVTVHPLPLADFDLLPDTACALETVGYLNNSLGALTYAWDFGDGNTSTTASPSHAYANAGTYDVELIAYTGFNCTDTITQQIVIDSIPTSQFMFSIECVGDSTSFTDQSFGGVVNYLWDFGDGNTSTLQNPNHLYASAGTYSVSLTVNNLADCPVTSSQLVTVNSVPVADFSNGSSCIGQNMQFNDLSSGVPVGWEWDFGDGSPINNNQNPSYQYASVGQYTVELVVSGGSGCSDTISYVVQVDSIPTADFSFIEDCANDTSYFTNLSLGAPDSYEWDFDDGAPISTQINPNHVYTNDGNYNVMLIASYALSGCADTIIQTVAAYPRTVPDFTTNTPCLGASTNFSDNTTGTPNSWEWDFGDGSPVVNTQNPSHTYAADGIYQVQLITENAFGCIDTLQQNVEVFPLPVADFENDTICDGAITNFIDLSTNAVSWEWDFGDGSPLDLNQSPSHVFPSNGSFTVQLVVTNAFACTDTQQITAIVNPNPTALFEVDTACFGYLNNFTDLSTGAISWQWDFGDTSPFNNNQNPSYTYSTEGTYSAELLVTNVFGCQDSLSLDAVVLPQPEAGFENATVCAGDIVAFSDTTLGAPNTWSWDFGDGSPLDNSQNPSHTYITGGVYNVTLIAGNNAGCLDTTIVPVDVYTVPIPDFNADTVCYLSVSNFTDLSTDAVALSTWEWDFDDGNTSNSQNPTYIFQAPGIYNVNLIVTNINGCDSTITYPVIVNDVPVAEYTFDTVCVGSPTTFSDLSTGAPSSWMWDFGDGNTSTNGPVVQNTYAGPGSYLVSLIVDGGTANCTDQVFHVVTVSDVVNADMQFNDTTCVNSNVVFTDISTITQGNIVAWTWDFGDGSPLDNSQNTNHTYSTAGIYTVTLSVESSGGCISTISQDLYVFELPSAQFTANTPCEGQATDFIDQSTSGSGNIVTWDWTFGDGSPNDNTQNPSHIYAMAGNYNVTLLISDDIGCQSLASQNVTIYPQPNAAFTNDTVCGGLPVSFTDLSTVTNDIIVDWHWNFNDGGTQNVQNPSHVFNTSSDSFPVTLVVTTSLGCIDSVTQTIFTHPVVDFDFAPLTTAGCPALTVEFEDLSTTSSGATIINWLWDFDDGTFSFAQNPTHVFTDEGDYYVALTVTTLEGCVYSDTLTYPITVFPKPIAGFSMDASEVSIFDPVVEFTDESIDAIDWEWEFGDNTYSNLTNPLHEYSDTGWFTITQIVYNAYGCSDTAEDYVHVSPEFAFYVPNAFTPNNDGVNDFFIGKGFGYIEYNFLIFDRWGNKILDTKDDNVSWDGTYNGKDAPMDVYVWKVVILDVNREQHVLRGHVTLVR